MGQMASFWPLSSEFSRTLTTCCAAEQRAHSRNPFSGGPRITHQRKTCPPTCPMRHCLLGTAPLKVHPGGGLPARAGRARAARQACERCAAAASWQVALATGEFARLWILDCRICPLCVPPSKRCVGVLVADDTRHLASTPCHSSLRITRATSRRESANVWWCAVLLCWKPTRPAHEYAQVMCTARAHHRALDELAASPGGGAQPC